MIVDNASQDGSFEIITRHLPSVQWMQNPDFLMYSEELELCNRFAKKGYKSFIAIKSQPYTSMVAALQTKTKVPVQWPVKCSVRGYTLQMLNAEKGKIWKLNGEMEVYRVGSGVWSSMNYYKRSLKWVYLLIQLIRHFFANKKIYAKIKKQQKKGIA